MFQALSWLQRGAEGLLNVPVQFVKHTATSSFRGLGPRGLGKRARALGADLIEGESTRAWRENADMWRDWAGRVTDKNRGLLQRGLTAATAPLRAATQVGDHLIAGTADVAGLAAGAAGSGLGYALGITARAAGATGYLAGKGAWKLGKAVAGPIGYTAGEVGLTVGKDAVRATAGAVGGTARFLWNTRKNPVVGNMLVGGAVVGGAAYGHTRGGYTNSMGFVTNELSKPAYMLNDAMRTPSPLGYQASRKGSMELDDLGASGDLVFALNNLR